MTPKDCKPVITVRGLSNSFGEQVIHDDLDLTVGVGLEFTDDVEAAGRRHAEGYAFTFGAMGSATTNFYNNAFERQGYGDDVREVQRLWLAGDKKAARERVPTEIGLGTRAAASIADILASRDRTAAGRTAPPHGLFLVRVDYDSDSATDKS